MENSDGGKGEDFDRPNVIQVDFKTGKRLDNPSSRMQDVVRKRVSRLSILPSNLPVKPVKRYKKEALKTAKDLFLSGNFQEAALHYSSLRYESPEAKYYAGLSSLLTVELDKDSYKQGLDSMIGGLLDMIEANQEADPFPEEIIRKLHVLTGTLQLAREKGWYGGSCDFEIPNTVLPPIIPELIESLMGILEAFYPED